MCPGPMAAVKTACETGGAARTWSRFCRDKDKARTCAWIQDHTWHECEKKMQGRARGIGSISPGAVKPTAAQGLV